MATPRISEAVQKQILQLFGARLSQHEVGCRLGINQSTVNNYLHLAGADKHITAPAAVTEPLPHETIRKALRNVPLSTDELANALDCSPCGLIGAGEP
jgi:DNA-binding transcriptional regulator LsrR (DeoR family)